MKSIKIETLLDPSRENLAIVNQGLHAFNLAQLGEKLIYTYDRVLIIAKDHDSKVVGGIHGEMYWEWLHIDTLWVDESYRNQRIGSSLLEEIEAAAVSEGFLGSHLETTDFQAVDFYQKNGYEIFGKLAGKPTGHTWYYMKKILTSQQPDFSQQGNQ